ncbi:hypothetical protein B0H14DRAFT_3455913 [Mycena olivaceomarginata]|nr:hypothetical protein B0H14DRAFT_3455913 [Mycena olivaceomarginata]
MAFTAEQTLVMLVVASWLNIALYAVEIVLCGRYFGRRSTRPRTHKAGVAALVFFDTVCTLAISFNVCIAVVKPTTLSLRLFVLPLSMQIITTYISAAIAELFLCNLFYVLTGSVVVTGVILILILLHLAFSWASAIILLEEPLNLASFSFTATTSVGAISCAATDVIIALCLTYRFWTMMSRTLPQYRTRSLLRRIMVLTISSGAICAGNTFLMMILLLKGSPIFTFFFTCQGRVYALTLLGNFLVGVPAQRATETTPSQRLGGTHSNNVVVFRTMAVETSISAADPMKSGDRLRSPTTGSTLSSHTQTNHDRPSSQSEELALGPMQGKGKTDPERDYEE